MKKIISVGVALLIAALLVIINRVRLAGQSVIEGDSITFTFRDEASEHTLLCVEGLLGVLGVGLILIGVAKLSKTNRDDDKERLSA